MRKRAILAIVLGLAFLAPAFFANQAFAETGDETVYSSACANGLLQCWSSQIIKGGGLVWLYKDVKQLNFAPWGEQGDIRGMKYPNSATGDLRKRSANCQYPGVWFLVALWHYNSDYLLSSGGNIRFGLTGYVYGPIEQSSVEGGYQNNMRDITSADFGGNAFTWLNGEHSGAEVKTAAEAEAAFKTSGNDPSKWGHISWFCGKVPETEPPTTTNTCPLKSSNIPGATNIAGSGNINSGTSISYSGIRIKNTSSYKNIYGDYQPFVYGKPSDVFNWAHCYYKEEQEVTYTHRTDAEVEHKTGSCGHKGTQYSAYWSAPGIPEATDLYFPSDRPRNKYIVTEITNDQNTGQIDTSNTGLFGGGLSFSKLQLSGTDISVSGSGYLKGTQKKNGSIVVFSGSGGRSNYTYTVQPGHAGEVSTQKVTTVWGTNAAREPGDTWRYNQDGTCWYQWEGLQAVPPKPVPIPCPPAYLALGITDCGTTLQPQDPIPNGIWTPEYYNITAHHTGVYVVASTTGGNGTSQASIYIPYNFTTKVSSGVITQDVTSGSSRDQVVMSNEKVTVSGASFSIVERYNQLTYGSYTTETLGGTAKLVSFYLRDDTEIPGGSESVLVDKDNVCDYFNGFGAIECKDLETQSGPFSPGTHMFGTYTHNIRNLPAGYKYCVASSVTPTNSGDDNNGVIGKTDGTFDETYKAVDNSWHIAGPTCRTIASSPNIQVWGGNMANAGTVKTGINYKNQNEGGVGRYFGSWAEFAIINNGKLTGFSSGAAIGYGGPYNAIKIKNGSIDRGNVGGVANINSLYYAPLTIPNSDCGTTCYNISTPSGIKVSNSLIERLIERYNNGTGMTECKNRANCTVNASDVGLTISSPPTLGKGQTYVYYSSGDITINSNLSITKGPFTSSKDVPNFVIIAKGDIKIKSGVSEINAWLISGKTVNTCYDRPDNRLSVDDDACGKLKINGIVYANKLEAKRSGGGGAQESNGLITDFKDSFNTEPSEVINLSVSSYLWAFGQAHQDTEAHTVYTRTLAPRL